MGNWAEVSSTNTSSAAALAPNIASATCSVTTQIWAHLTVASFGGSITLPSSLGTLAVLEVYVVTPSGKEIQIARFDSGFTGGGTLAYSGYDPQLLQTGSAQTGYAVKFVCYNGDFTPTPSPYTVSSLTIPAGSITSLSGVDHVAVRWADQNRSTHAPQTVSITVSDPKTYSLWLYDGTKNQLQGWYSSPAGSSSFDIGLKEQKEIIYAPVSSSTWTLRAAPGTWEGNDTDGWRCTDLGIGPVAIGSVPGLVSSSGYSVSGMGLPLATNITALTIDSGIGGNFPYDETDASGFHDWCIQFIQFDPTNARNDPNTFTCILTCQDLDASGSPIGPEHIYGTPQVSAEGTSQDFGMLNGPYGQVATPARSGNMGKVRLRVYCGNRKDQTTEAWRNAAATTLQNLYSVGYKDVVVSVLGTTPSGAVTGSRSASTNRSREVARVQSAQSADVSILANSIDVLTAGGEIKIDPTTLGISAAKTVSGATKTAALDADTFQLSDGVNPSSGLSSQSINWISGKFHVDGSAKFTKIANITCDSYGVPVVVWKMKSTGNTGSFTVDPLDSGAVPAGQYRINIAVWTTFTSLSSNAGAVNMHVWSSMNLGGGSTPAASFVPFASNAGSGAVVLSPTINWYDAVTFFSSGAFYTDGSAASDGSGTHGIRIVFTVSASWVNCSFNVYATLEKLGDA